METSVKAPAKKSGAAFKSNLDIIIICLSLCVPAVYYGGLSAFLNIISCIGATALSEFVFIKSLLKKQFSSDMSFLVTGLVIALLLPSWAPVYVGISACIFAVAVCVFPFGGWCNTPFIPSAAGIAFAVTAFRNELTNFEGSKDLATRISEGEIFSLDFFSVTDILSGSLPGAMGCTCVLALIASAIYIFIRNRKRLISSSGYLLAAAIYAFFFPRVNAGRFSSAFLEICAGSLLFTALLLINDNLTSPEKKLRAFIYGFSGGIIAMLLRTFSPTLMPEIFSVLFMNALWPALTGETVNRKLRFDTPTFFSKRKEASTK